MALLPLPPGMTPAETAALTLAMRDSGEVMRWPSEGGALIDKHSTGGVGDKVSLVLAPLWAALGYRVPMISGRGLEITGGTLDKLESIPGYRCDLETDELSVSCKRGCFISGQTGDLAPADKILCALRNDLHRVLHSSHHRLHPLENWPRGSTASSST